MDFTATDCFILEDLNGPVTEILMETSAPLEKGREYWIINLEEKEKLPPDSRLTEYIYTFIPTESANTVGDGVKIKIQGNYIIAPKGSPVIESPAQVRVEQYLMRDKLLNPEPKEIIQVGRPETYPKKKTLEWYNELKQERDFQHKNGAPLKREIKERIIELHTRVDEESGQLLKPSMDTINTQFRKLGLTKR